MWKTEKKHLLYTVYADIRACKKTHMHITTYRSISPGRQKWSNVAFCSFFLELYCDQTVWFFPVTMLLPWTWPSCWWLPLQCPWHFEMKYKKPLNATMLNSSDAIVHEICRCPWWSIHCGGEIQPPQDNMLEQPQICERESDLTWIDLVWYLWMGRRGNDKDWPITRAI